MPKYHAAVAQITIADMAAHRAISALPLLLPKSTILYIVAATEAFIDVITKTPRKLKIAAIMIAFLTPIALVETQVAIAFGASVHPFTRITPNVKTVETSSIGF